MHWWEYLRRWPVVAGGNFQEAWFREGVLLGAVAAARAAGEPSSLTSDGVRVTAVIDDGPSEGAVREGDVVVAVDGDPVRAASDVLLLSEERPGGEVVTLRVIRDGTPMTVEVTLPADATSGPGLIVEALNLRSERPIQLRGSEASPIHGPSVGLAAMLAAYDLFADEDLAAGRTVAATGVVDDSGTVHPVGCVRPKAATAAEANADVLLVPARQAAAARDAIPDEGLRVVPVRDLDEALDALGVP